MRLSEHGLLGTFYAAMRRPVPPAGRGYLRFGWLLLLLLAAQVISGVLLAVYYRPTPELASKSVAYIMRSVRWGWLIRGIHHWASFFVLALAGLQLVRIVATGAYQGVRRPRWTLGLLLLLALVGLAISGDLLPWDADAYWTARALLAEVERMPWLGAGLANVLRGSADVGADTLSRAFVLHVLLLPALVLLLVGVNLWMLERRARGEVRQ
jgi:quinol-cytochrome oxidoreductase complex cytochrome b subunit